MKFNSDILFRLARAVVGATSTPDDGLIDIPTAILPVATLRGPTVEAGGFSGTLNQRESVSIGTTAGLAASTAASQTTIITFGRGIWHVAWRFTHVADYNQAIDGSLGGAARMNLVDPEGSAAVFLDSFARTAIDTQNGEVEYLFDKDGWGFRLDLAATGVAQTHQATFAVTASRLT